METNVKIYDSLGAAVADVAGGAKIERLERAYGGDINNSFCAELSGGGRLFIKTNRIENLGFFVAEAAGLAALAECGKIATAKALAAGTDSRELGGCAFLVLEHIASGARSADYWRNFGRELAALHKADCSAFTAGGRYGFFADNYIGATEQHNAPCDSWVEFFRSRRLEPQFKRAGRFFDKAFAAKAARLLERLGDFLAEPPFPSLLHGDLWSGNIMPNEHGKAALIDPAAYVGHFEADLAMTELFGGFPRAFYAAYAEANPPQAGYAQRRDLYNLYHLLNHLNLFGAGYLGSVRAIVESFYEKL